MENGRRAMRGAPQAGLPWLVRNSRKSARRVKHGREGETTDAKACQKGGDGSI
jgi:hypothetical protein